MSIAERVSAWNRGRKWRQFVEEVKPDSETTILDAGYSDKEYSSVDNFLEKTWPHHHRITALGVDEPDEFRVRYPKVRVIRYDGRSFPFSDDQFDVCWSNAVIEHVGGRAQQKMFLREMIRVARTVFFTTPNRLFPVEVHTRTPFLHLLPKDIFDAYLRAIGKGWATGNYMNLLSHTELEALLKEAFGGTYKITRNRALGITLDFSVYVSK